MNPEGPSSHAGAVLERQEGGSESGPFPLGDPARAAGDLVNRMREQEHWAV